MLEEGLTCSERREVTINMLELIKKVTYLAYLSRIENLDA